MSNLISGFISGIIARFTEPSSWASIAGVIAALLSVPVDSPLIKSIELAGVCVAGILGFYLREKAK